MAKKVAVLFGVIFVLVGVLGFFPSPLVGMAGVFETDALRNIVHLLFGLVLLVVAMKSPAKSAHWLKILGVVYLVLAVLGFLMIGGGGKLLGLVHMNHADHWLHVVLGVVLLGAGLMAKKATPAMPASPNAL